MADIQAVAADRRAIYKEIAGEEDGRAQALERPDDPIMQILAIDRTERHIGRAELNGRIGIGRIAWCIGAKTGECLDARIGAGPNVLLTERPRGGQNGRLDSWGLASHQHECGRADLSWFWHEYARQSRLSQRDHSIQRDECAALCGRYRVSA